MWFLQYIWSNIPSIVPDVLCNMWNITPDVLCFVVKITYNANFISQVSLVETENGYSVNCNCKESRFKVRLHNLNYYSCDHNDFIKANENLTSIQRWHENNNIYKLFLWHKETIYSLGISHIIIILFTLLFCLIRSLPELCITLITSGSFLKFFFLIQLSSLMT